MENILEIRNLSKKYEGFQLQNINLDLPKGCIMGVVGENGAGKSTLIKLILNLIERNSGKIRVFGKDNRTHEKEIKEKLGVVLDESSFPENMTTKDISIVMKSIYKNWDEKLFRKYLARFSLPESKKIKDYSKGMKMKLSIVTALTHHPSLLILDEPTSGLDPMVRDEILDLFLEFIQDEEKSILVSSHIISDLEKTADYISFIHKGRLMFSESKDHLLESYGILKCTHAQFEKIQQDAVIGIRKSKFGVEALVKRGKLRGNYVIDPAGIEDIMLFHSRGVS